MFQSKQTLTIVFVDVGQPLSTERRWEEQILGLCLKMTDLVDYK